MADAVRTYDRSLVQKIRGGEHIEQIDGLPVVMKPIPDDERANVLDPRVREVAARKRAMFEERSERSGGYSLANERYRPDKKTIDLVAEEIEEKEQLIDVNGTHKIDVFTYRDRNVAVSSKAYIFLHGGGFTAGNEHIYHNQMRYLAQLTGALIVFPDYRLAPENPFPAAIEDALATIEWVGANSVHLGVDPEKIMLGGDSAGGSLACACLLKDEKRLVKRAYLLFASCDCSDYREQKLYRWSEDLFPVVKEDYELAWSRINRIRSAQVVDSKDSAYIQGKTSLKDPMVSVVYASDEQLSSFPPVTVAVSEYDFLRPGAEYLARRLYALGKEMRLVKYCGCDHGFLDLFGFEPQAEEVCMDMADELDKV